MSPHKPICSASIAPLVGAEVITKGDILKGETAFPPAVTHFVGGSLSISCETTPQMAHSLLSKIVTPLAKAPLFPGRYEQDVRKFRIDLSYAKGGAEYNLNGRDLPLPANSFLASVIQFNFSNQIESHRIQLMLDWPASGPLLAWREVQFLEPWYGVGLLVVVAKSKNNQTDPDAPQPIDYALMGSLKLEAAIMTLVTKDVKVSLVGGGSANVGQAFGFTGYATLVVAQNLGR